MGVYHREGSKNWWLRYRDASGKLSRRSAETTIKAVALARLAEIEATVLEEVAAKESAMVEILPGDDPDAALEERVAALEDKIRRLILEKQSQIRFLEAWARSSRKLIKD